MTVSSIDGIVCSFVCDDDDDDDDDVFFVCLASFGACHFVDHLEENQNG